MATIKISDLRPAGTQLFSDSESYMSELSDGEFDSINGGIAPLLIISAFRVGYAAARSSQQCAASIAGGIGAVDRWLNR